MKRLLIIALVLLCPSLLPAQLSAHFEDFTLTNNGFTVNWLFRNVNGYADPTIIALGTDLAVSVQHSQKIMTFCAQVLDCVVGGSGTGPGSAVGSVERDLISFGPLDAWTPSAAYSEVSCAVFCPVRPLTMSGVVLGCQVPDPHQTRTYFGRTCDADGYTGWLRLNVRFLFSQGNTVVPVPLFDVSDVNVSMQSQILPGPNAINVVPEPTTLALAAFALPLLYLTRRTRA